MNYYFFRYPTDTVLGYCIRINGAHLNSLTVLVSDRRVEIEKKSLCTKTLRPFYEDSHIFVLGVKYGKMNIFLFFINGNQPFFLL